jgi:hypothetical protein
MTTHQLVRVTGSTAILPEQLVQALTKHRGTLQRWANSDYLTDNSQTPILPPAEVAKVQAELAALGRGCHPDIAIAIATKLAMSYPQLPSDDRVAVKTYLGAIATALGGYPEAIAAEAASTVLSQNKFRPSVAELIEAAEAVKSRLTNGAAHGLLKMQAEAEKRAEAAARKKRHEAEYRQRCAETDAAVVAALGSDGVRPGDLMAASRCLGFRQAQHLTNAARAGEKWAALVIRAGALLSRIHVAACDRRATYAEALAVAEALAEGRLDAAAEIVAAADARPVDPVSGVIDPNRDPRTRPVPWTKILETASPALRMLDNGVVFVTRAA